VGGEAGEGEERQDQAGGGSAGVVHARVVGGSARGINPGVRRG
jgi:hypothetical protein